MTTYHQQVINLQDLIYKEDYWVKMWEYVLTLHNTNKQLLLSQTYSDEHLTTILNQFWGMLPDDMTIHRPPFNVLCDLCEGTDDNR